MRHLIRRNFCWLLFLWCGIVAGPLQVCADDFDNLRIKWRDMLTGGTNLDLNDSLVRSRLNSIASTANSHWSSLNTSPARTYLWSDAARPDQSEDITTCYNRLRAMALAWATRGCSLQSNSALAADIIGGLDWMYAHHYHEGVTTQYDNWWDWEIGAPQQLNNAAVLMFDLLTPAQIANYNRAVDRFVPNPQDTGANRTDSALVIGIRGILGLSSAKLASCRDGLSPVFPYVTSGDGFYTDGSFIQHSRHPYTGSYGSVLMDGLSRLMWLLAGSPWQVTDPASANIFRWVYDSYEPVIYKGATLDNLRGRAISRQSNTDHSAGAGNMSSILQIAQFAPAADALAIKRMLKYWIQADTVRSFTNNVGLHLLAATRQLMADTSITPRGEVIGHYRFPSMDRVMHLRPGFGLALSMSSSRIYTYESINGENLRGWFTGDGMTTLYTYDLGQFTGNYWPTIDPYHLPGTTVDLTTRTDGSGQSATTGQNWVGGAGLAEFGATGMSLDAQASTLVALKSWFMFDNEIVCLGAGITCGSSSPVHTTIENRKLGAGATNEFRANGLVMPAALGWNSNFTSATSCSLAGAAGYYFPGGANVSAKREARTNSWSAINKGGSTASVFESYLTLWFNHGTRPTNASYAYVILPNFTAPQTAAYASAPEISVLQNTPAIQAVRENTLGITAVNFWNSGNSAVDFITVNNKASVVVREAAKTLEVAIADPTQTNTGTLVLTLNRAATWFVSADAGVTVQQLSPQVRVAVAVNGARGKSFRLKLSTDPRNPNPTWDADTNIPGAQDGSGTWNSSGTNWWDGVGNVFWNDAFEPAATFGAGGSGGTINVAGARTASALVFAPLGSGAYTLAGASPLTLRNGITANASATIDLPVEMTGDQTWQVAAGGSLTLGKSLLARTPSNLALAGAGTLRLVASTSQLGGALGQVSILEGLTLELADKVETIPQLILQDGVLAKVTGSGRLQVAGNSNLRIGGVASGATQELDLSRLAGFICNTPERTFSVGGQTSTVAGNGILRLATNSTVSARIFAAQNTTGATATQSRGTIYLGRHTTINADQGQVGMVRDIGTIRFAPGTENPVLTIRGTDGSSPANEWVIGSRSSSYFSSSTGMLDLVTGVVGSSSLDARIDSLKLANEGYCLTASANLHGQFTMGGGSLEVGNIILGLKSSVSTQSLGVVNATFTQNSGMVAATSLVFGVTEPGNTGTINATYRLLGGTLAAQNIQPGPGPANRTFTWNQGTVSNLAGSDLKISLPALTLSGTGLHRFEVESGRTIEVDSVMTGSGQVTKAGSGRLWLKGASTFSGDTLMLGGTLEVDGALNGSGGVTVATNAELRGSGRINGPVQVQPGGTLAASLLRKGMEFGSHLVLAGNLLVELSRSASPSNGIMTVSGAITNVGSGRVIVVNAGTNALLPGDRFYVFNQPVANGGGLSVSDGGGVTWSNRLALDGSIEVAAIVAPPPRQLNARIAGNELSLSWPAEYTGCWLAANTNNLASGPETNQWFRWPGSERTNLMILQLSANGPATFFRLVCD